MHPSHNVPLAPAFGLRLNNANEATAGHGREARAAGRNSQSAAKTIHTRELGSSIRLTRIASEISLKGVLPLALTLNALSVKSAKKLAGLMSARLTSGPVMALPAARSLKGAKLVRLKSSVSINQLPVRSSAGSEA